MTADSLPDCELLIFDGACGTSLQRLELPAAAWDGHDGCNEYLNLSRPEDIVAMHRAFAAAGANVLETNTFGANRIVLAEYGLQARVAEINRAAVAHARRAAGEYPGVRVCGSIGPGAKLPLLEQVGVEELSAACAEQVTALVEAGVDLLIFETCQDLLQIKTALTACFDTLARLARSVPVMVSVTIESSGTMLTGSDMSAIVAALEPYPLFSLGLNCASGPREMAEHVRFLTRNWPRRISVMPNAGLPRLEDGRTIYPLSPDDFAAAVRRYVIEDGVSIVGGCCGTTPEHIRALAAALRANVPAQTVAAQTAAGRGADATPPPATDLTFPAVSSVYTAWPLHPAIPPFLIGERLNANGSKAFRECLLAGDHARALRIASQQESEGAMALDLCTAYAGRDEAADMMALVRLLRTKVKIPIMVDSTHPEVIEAALRLHPGRCIVNSISLEDGGATLDRVCSLARRYGAAVVALVIHQRGMAMTADDKVATARAIYERAVGKHGLRPGDLLFDALTFTIGSGDVSLRSAAVEALTAIRRIKAELPGVGTVLGVSNVSFGLAPASRRVLNSVFLHEAVAAGLDAAIVDVSKIVPSHAIGADDRQVCLDLIYNRCREVPSAGSAGSAEAATAPVANAQAGGPLAAFVRHFAARAGAAPANAGTQPADEHRPLEAQLAACIVRGEREGLEDLLDMLLRRYSAGAIVNTILVPAMRQTGRLFAEGELLLPFVLQSAETMRAAVRHLERFMSSAERRAGPAVLLATVQGDVHDIGKNLAGIILGNNGYTVHDLGIKVPAEAIIARARELRPAAIGLSGLLVKSALVMRENLELFREAGLTQPVFLGGAALTPEFVARECAPRYGAPVVYCADAFAGLRALREHEAGTLRSTTVTPAVAATVRGARRPSGGEPDRPRPMPRPPFLGLRHETAIALDDLLPYVNEQALFRGRWGYRRGKQSAEAHETLLRDQVRPLYEAIQRRVRDEGLLRSGVAYGYFRACADGDDLIVEHEGCAHRFRFPRQSFPPHMCIADYFRTEEEGGDTAGFFVATVGAEFDRAIRALHDANKYRDYLQLHGFSVELTEALAEFWHARMRRELGLDAASAGGTRYAFGYPACPGLDSHRPLFALLRPEALGVGLTESMQMTPEQSTSAIVVFHPQAGYFAV
ncbi:MAG: homocysteine S-methyltransferase family protein [Kiritimatiellae bacterium]|nr:homocysteine S-methyltransferase family protein [Kiritimatiellia bacterium]